MKILPQGERECQVVTGAGIMLLFIGLALPARDLLLIGVLVLALGVFAWVRAVRRIKGGARSNSRER